MNSLHYDYFQSPLGNLQLVASEDGICLIEFDDYHNLQKELSDLKRELKTPLYRGKNRHIQLAQQELSAYFAGGLKSL